MRFVRILTLSVALVGGIARAAVATPVTLQNATATFSQGAACGGPWLVSQAIDGVTSGINGWAIAQDGCVQTNAETAWFETATDQGPAVFTFTLTQVLDNPFHTLGKFELSYTTDSRIGGFSDTATWTSLALVSALATNGATLAITGNQVKAGGPNPETSVYTIITALVPGGVTGFRLGTLLDPDFFDNGPGRQPTNGNFVLTEFQVDAAMAETSPVPEPGTFALFGVGLAVAALARRKLA